MITGYVTADREAIIPLIVQGSDGKECKIEAAIDTGFNHFLTLPPAWVEELGLRFQATIQAILADDSVVPVGVYRGNVVWDGQIREIPILLAKGGGLVGMSMLEGYDLHVQVVDGGAVRITARR